MAVKVPLDTQIAIELYTGNYTEKREIVDAGETFVNSLPNFEYSRMLNSADRFSVATIERSGRLISKKREKEKQTETRDVNIVFQFPSPGFNRRRSLSDSEGGAINLEETLLSPESP